MICLVAICHIVRYIRVLSDEIVVLDYYDWCRANQPLRRRLQRHIHLPLHAFERDLILFPGKSSKDLQWLDGNVTMASVVLSGLSYLRRAMPPPRSISSPCTTSFYLAHLRIETSQWHHQAYDTWTVGLCAAETNVNCTYKRDSYQMSILW